MNKMNFPFLLGNGLDSVLIDYSGSMACNCNHLNYQHHDGAVCAWYKATHRDFAKAIPPILQSGYSLMAGGGENRPVVNFSQSFDPKRAILNTLVEANGFQIKIETFLTSNQILVEHYTLHKITTDRPVVALNLYPPGNLIHHKFQLKKREIRCTYEISGIKGMGIMYTDFPKVREEKHYNTGRLVISRLPEGNSFTKYLLILDQTDSHAYKELAEKRLDEVKSSDYQSILRAHQKEWEEYQQESCLDIPDKQLEYLYYLSLYLLRAHQNPKTGLSSVGNYSVTWGGGATYWESMLHQRAWLGTNKIKESDHLLAGYAKALPLAKDYAAKTGAKGAYFPWTMNYKGVALDYIHPNDFPGIEKWNNGCIVMQVWNHYLYTGDNEILRKYWDLIKDPVDFLISSLVEEKAKVAYIKEVEGGDESIPRKNEIFHLITTIKALGALVEAGKILNRDINPSYQRILEKLQSALKGNYQGNILLPYKGAKGIYTFPCFCLFLIDFSEGVPKKQIEADLKKYQGKLGLTLKGEFECSVWPFVEIMAAFALAHFKDKRAFQHLVEATKYTSVLGAFPEKIRPDGHPCHFWYLAPHADYVFALNSFLLQGNEREETIRILPLIPRSWKNLEFRNLRIPPGILVSLKLKEDKVVFLALKNETDRKLRKKLEIPSFYLPEARRNTWKNKYLILEPRQKLIIPCT